MNIYLMDEDNERFCIKAASMDEAVNICEQSYLEDLKEERKETYNHEIEKKYYHEEILQSCSLIGKLKN